MPSTRSIAMAGAQTAYPGNTTAINYNPAGLAITDTTMMIFNGFRQNYSWSLAEFTSNGLNAAFIRPGWAISFSRVESGNPDVLTTTDETGTPSKSNDQWLFHQYFLSLMYGRELTPKVAVGASFQLNRSESAVQLIESDILKQQTGLALDIGILYQAHKMLRMGMTVENLIHTNPDYVLFDYFTNIAFMDELPEMINLGIAFQPFERLSLALDIHNVFPNDTRDNNRNVDYRFHRSYHAGGELRITNRIWLRVGYMSEKTAINFSSDINTPLTYVKQNTVTAGIEVKTGQLLLGLAADFDQRKEELEKYQLDISGSGFRYFGSIRWLF
ncbi:hypothetical protein GF337_16540 [candidate division KSB1 bacterium]|nr:hypothetical protein [candidate division KSB1 bacterium]